jgi:hypothetical protein
MVRSNRGESLLDRARKHPGSSWARLTRTARVQEPGTVHDHAAPAPHQVAEAPPVADPSLDVALYSCGCGYVFEAPVSTSVGCPHCGDELAW